MHTIERLSLIKPLWSACSSSVSQTVCPWTSDTHAKSIGGTHCGRIVAERNREKMINIINTKTPNRKLGAPSGHLIVQHRVTPTHSIICTKQRWYVLCVSKSNEGDRSQSISDDRSVARQRQPHATILYILSDSTARWHRLVNSDQNRGQTPVFCVCAFLYAHDTFRCLFKRQRSTSVRTLETMGNLLPLIVSTRLKTRTNNMNPYWEDA